MHQTYFYCYNANLSRWDNVSEEVKKYLTFHINTSLSSVAEKIHDISQMIKGLICVSVNIHIIFLYQIYVICKSHGLILENNWRVQQHN